MSLTDTLNVHVIYDCILYSIFLQIYLCLIFKHDTTQNIKLLCLKSYFGKSKCKIAF